MSFETALRARAKSPAVMALVKSVEWDKRPQGSAYPAIVLEIITITLDRTMTDFHGKQYARVQASVFALNAPDMVAARDALIDAVSPRATVGGIRFEAIRSASIGKLNSQGETQFVHGNYLDATFWFTKEE